MRISTFIKAFVIIAIFISVNASAQPSTGTVRGFVYLKESGEPVLFTNVVLKGTTIGQATDVNGYYSITKIPPG
ncbi:MAG: carboxypeptidase-like regulatory domain-containing protein, partial [Bacteroidetes bacterium]|nr:carboxypeptidase-like regulatory domain-containing protein [Bacteroidota bacterium]